MKYIVEAQVFIIPDVNNMENTLRGRQREAWGGKYINYRGKRVRMLAEDDYGAILKKKLHKDAHGAEERQLKLSQLLFNCDGVKGGFDEDRTIGHGICGMKVLKQNMREMFWKYQ